MSFANLKIGARLGFGFALILVLLAAAVGLGLSSMGRISNRTDQIVDDHNVKTFAVTEMADNFRDISLIITNIVLLQDDASLQEKKNQLGAAREKYGKAKKVFLDTELNENEKELLSKLDAAIKYSAPIVNKVVELGMQNKNEEATELLVKQSLPSIQKAIGVIEEIIQYEKDQGKAAAEHAKADYTSARNLMLGLGGLAIVLGGVISLLITRSITRPINAAVKVAETVAAGDLSSRIDVTSKDETGQLLQALKDMNDSLLDIVGRVRSGTDTIATASSQIASGNLDLSSRTEQQASSLEETASSMEELTSTVKQNADNAHQANSLALSASEVAVKGGAVVAEVVDTMGAINESARKIVDIISVIDGIAFQTNILALNAAVEAARAGEQGRGFAVVAAEVRILAQRSAAAAKEIKELISDSVNKVDAGSKLVHQAGATMDEIVDGIRRVTDIMGEITAASTEQSAGIEQVNQAIAQMDEVTQQNAALVEEAAAAASSLQDQAGSLAQVVGVFRFDGMRAAAPVPAHAAIVKPLPGKAPLRAVGAIPRPAVAARELAVRTASKEDWEEF